MQHDLINILNILVKQIFNKNGYLVMKSYFDPVLKKNKKTEDRVISNLKLINSLHIYAT